MTNPETQKIWTYHDEIDTLNDAPPLHELEQAWLTFHNNPDLLTLGTDFFGICEKPDHKPRAVVSLDLCEVVRDSALSLTRISGHGADKAVTHEARDYYHHAIDINNWDEHELGANHMLVTSMRAMMNMKQVEAVPFSEAINAFMNRWRQNSVFTIANTSTLPGCEKSTIEFLAEKYPGATRGILLPRNYDGNGTTTKSSILSHSLDKMSDHLGEDVADVPLVAIEDVAHHAVKYTEDYKDMHVFMPEYNWNSCLDENQKVTRVTRGYGTLDTFIAVDNYLIHRGVIIN